MDYVDTNSESSLIITCNMVSVLPREYDQVMEVEEPEDETDVEMARHRPVCYYVMNNGCVDEHNTFFERPDEGMKNHLKPLFIIGKMENVGVNKILVDDGAIVNLMLHYMLKKSGRMILPLNLIIWFFIAMRGRWVQQWGFITIGTITRPTMFMVI